MAFVAMNGFDVEHASSMLVYENLFPEIQHINGKGCIDKYTKTSDIEDVTYIDIMRVLPYAPSLRQLGSKTNGAWHNSKNVGGINNAPQSTKYTIPVDLIYDRGVPILSSQTYSNPIDLKQVVLAQVVKSVALTINAVTFAKQIEGFFRNGDNFDKAKSNTKGSITASDITSNEIDSAVFAYDPSVVATDSDSAAQAFLGANEELNDGIPEIGAFVIPTEERQAFITPQLNRILKSQYMQNASEASARILANGFINPFNGQESTRVDSRTGICGMYDGVDMYLFNKITRIFTYIYLGVYGTDNDGDATLTAVRATLDKLNGLIVYGAGTVRGIVGPVVEVNKQVTQGGVYVLPRMKMGVEVIHGATIKAIVNAGANKANAWTAEDIAKVMNTVEFVAVDGEDALSNIGMSGFNDGTSN